VPINFLSEDQRRRFGRFADDPDEGQLAGSFLLDQTARRRAMAAKGARNRIGWAIQLGTVRYLGTFLDNPEQVPGVVVDYVAEQLGLEPAEFAGYGTKEHRWDHQEQIREGYGYTKFEFDQWFALARWMYQRAWIGSERPTLLFDLATKRLVDKKVVLPGVTVLERLVSGSRERAEKRLWATLAAAPTQEQAAGLQGLVVVPVGKRLSELDRLRRSPRDITARGVGKALERYEALNTFGGTAWDLSAIPPGRLQALVRFARAARAQAVSDLAGNRRLATLVAFAAVMPQVAADEAIEVFDLVMGDLIRSSSTKMTKQRLRTLKDLDAAAILLREMWIAVSGTAADPEGDIRATLDAMDVGPFHAAAETVKLLAQEPDDGAEQMLAARPPLQEGPRLARRPPRRRRVALPAPLLARAEPRRAGQRGPQAQPAQTAPSPRPGRTRHRNPPILPQTPTSATHRPRLLRRPARPLHPEREPHEFLINRVKTPSQRKRLLIQP